MAQHVQADALGVVSEALKVLGSPVSDRGEKLRANEVIEQVKVSGVGIVLSVGAGLSMKSQGEDEALIVFGYGMLSDLVQRRWAECSEEQKKNLEGFASERLGKVLEQQGSSSSVRNHVCQFVAMVLSRQSGETFSNSWSYILKFGEGNEDQCAMVCNVSRFLCEEAVNAGNKAGNEHAALLSTLISVAAQTLQFLSKVSEMHYGIGANSEGEQRLLHWKLVSTALSSIEVWCELVPLKNIDEGGVLWVCEGLLTTQEFEVPILRVMDKLLLRKDPSEADISVAIKAGLFIVSHLEKYHDARRKATPSNIETDRFDQIHATCSALSTFAECYHKYLDAAPNKITQRDVVIVVLNVFEFSTWGIHITTLPFWKRFLTDLNPAKNKKDDVKKEGVVHNNVINDNHWVFGIAQRLVHCMFRLLDQLHAAKNTDCEDNDLDPMQDAGGRSRQVVGACITLMLPLFPKLIEQHVLTILHNVMESCTSDRFPENVKVERMKALVVVVDRVMNERCVEIYGLVNVILEQLFSINNIGEHVDLAMQFGRVLQRCFKSFTLNESSCMRIVPPILNVLFKLPMPTDGLGLRINVPNMANLLDARQCLSSGLRLLAEQAPEAFLPHVDSIKLLIEQGKAGDLITLREINVFMEVLILASRSGPLQLQNGVLQWSFGSLWNDWKQKTWLWERSSLRLKEFLTCFLPVEGQHANGLPVVGGCEERWRIFHQLVFLANVFSRQPPLIWEAPESPIPSTSVDALLELVVAVANIFRLILDMFDPANATYLGPLKLILQLGHDEMETLTGVAKMNRQSQNTEESYGVAAPTLSSSRKWLAFVFDRCTRMLLGVGRACPNFWQHAILSQHLPRMLPEKLPFLDMRFRRLILHQVVIPWTTLCPPWRQEIWLFPLLRALLSQLRFSLKSNWEDLASKSKQRSGRGAQGEFEEIVFEMLLREQTIDTTNLLNSMAKAPDGYDPQRYSILFRSLVNWDPTCLKLVTDLCLDLIKVTDRSIIEKTIDFLRFYLNSWGKLEEVKGVVASDLLPASLMLLFDARMEPCTPKILYLIVEILRTCWEHPSTIVSLLKLPGMTHQLVEVLSGLQKLSLRKQKDLLSRTLNSACGSQLAALPLPSNSKTVKRLTEPREREPKAPAFDD